MASEPKFRLLEKVRILAHKNVRSTLHGRIGHVVERSTNVYGDLTYFVRLVDGDGAKPQLNGDYLERVVETMPPGGWACVKQCGDRNEYQDGPYTCGKCRHEARLMAENAPQVKAAPTAAPAGDNYGRPLSMTTDVLKQALRNAVDRAIPKYTPPYLPFVVANPVGPTASYHYVQTQLEEPLHLYSIEPIQFSELAPPKPTVKLDRPFVHPSCPRRFGR